MTLALVRSPPASRQIRVRGSFQFQSHQGIHSRHTIHTDLVHQGISEKVAVAVSFISAFFTGFILAYARNWRLALAMSSILPWIAITGGVMNKLVSKYMQYV